MVVYPLGREIGNVSSIRKYRTYTGNTMFHAAPVSRIISLVERLHTLAIVIAVVGWELRCSSPHSNWTPQLGRIRASNRRQHGRKPRVDRSPEEKWRIVQEGLKSGNVSETCRRHGIAANLFIAGRMKRSRERRQRLGGEALPRPKPRRTIASGNWSGHWAARRWRLRS